tara:strand:- start:435 stop:542 length:108 start_codon:yes stop_codon:yes gene_type:complete
MQFTHISFVPLQLLHLANKIAAFDVNFVKPRIGGA